MFVRDSTCLVLLRILPLCLSFRLQDFHPLWSAFPYSSAKIDSRLYSPLPQKQQVLLVQAPPISLATTLGIEFSFFSCPYLDVSVQGVPLHMLLYLHMNKLAFTQFEFPHSDIHDSQDICSSSWLFAAYHVLLRLLVPRYSPYALSSLTFFRMKNFVLLRKTSLKSSSMYTRTISSLFVCFSCNTRFCCKTHI